MTTKAKVQPDERTRAEPQPAFHPFYYDVNSTPRLQRREEARPDFADGIDNYLKTRGYQLLTGSTSHLETYESQDSPARFLVLIHLEHYLFAVMLHDLRTYTKFMDDFANKLPVLAYLFLPEQAPPPDNRVYNVFSKPVRW